MPRGDILQIKVQQTDDSVHVTLNGRQTLMIGFNERFLQLQA